MDVEDKEREFLAGKASKLNPNYTSTMNVIRHLFLAAFREHFLVQFLTHSENRACRYFPPLLSCDCHVIIVVSE